MRDGTQKKLIPILYVGIASVAGLSLFQILFPLADAHLSHRTVIIAHSIFIATLFGALTYLYYRMRKSEELAKRHAADEFQRAELAKLNSIILQTLSFPMDIVDSQGKILFANKHMMDLFGRDIRGERCWEIYKDDRQQCKDCLLCEPVALGQTRSTELSCHTRTVRGVLEGQVLDISHTWIEYEGRSLVFRIYQDLTERKKTEKAIRLSEAKYRTLVETTDTGFLILDHQGRVKDANEEYVRLSGHNTLAEILGRSVVEWTAEYEQQKNAEAVAKCVKDGYIRNLTIDYVDRQGRITPVEINATVEGKEETLQIISLCRNITERRKLERERAAMEIQFLQLSKLASMGTLASGVAHEINNPLAIIITCCDLIAKLLKNLGGNEEIASCLGDQRKAVERAATIVKGLRILARLETSDNKVFDIHKAIKATLAFFGPLCIKYGIVIKEDLRSNQPVILANEGGLHQVVVHLLTNAKDACEGKESGIITVETAEEGAWVVLRITDNGSGIAKEHLPRIFDPFFTTKPVGKGAGLGLSISHSIIQSFGGTMRVESEQGKGTSLSIAIPSGSQIT